MHTLVAFKMVLLDETHITYITLKWFLTSVDQDVPLEVVTAPESSKAVLTNKIFWDLYLERAILFHYHHLFNSLFRMGGLGQAVIVFAAPGFITVFSVALTRAPQHIRATCPLAIFRLLAGNLA